MMTNQQLMNQIMEELLRHGVTVKPASQSSGGKIMDNFLNSTSTVPEFVGASEIGDTIGMCIPSVDALLLDHLHVQKRFTVIGILSSRMGAGPQIMAMDEAVKATNTEVIDIEMPRDTKGGAGHGVLILVGGYDPSDVRSAIQVALDNYQVVPSAMRRQFRRRAFGTAVRGPGCRCLPHGLWCSRG